jgi:hypothetical protein
MPRRWLLALGLLSAVLLLWFLAVPQPEKLAPQPEPALVRTEPAALHPSQAGGPAGEPQPAPAAPPPSAAPTAPTATKPSASPAAEAPSNHAPPPKAEGPVDEYKTKYEHEPRDSTAQAAESAVQSAFRQPDVPPGLFKSVLCRQTICKIEVHWAEDRAPGYMAGLMRVFSSVGQKMAFEPLGGPDATGNYELNVYVSRGLEPAK